MDACDPSFASDCRLPLGQLQRRSSRVERAAASAIEESAFPASYLLPPAYSILINLYLLVHKLLVLLQRSRQHERIRHIRFALHHAGDHVGASDPVRLRKVSL